MRKSKKIVKESWNKFAKKTRFLASKTCKQMINYYTGSGGFALHETLLKTNSEKVMNLIVLMLMHIFKYVRI